MLTAALFPALRSVFGLTVSGNFALEGVNFDALEVAPGGISVSGNRNLQLEPTNFAAVRQVQGAISFTQNKRIGAVDFASLTHVGSVTFVENGNLLSIQLRALRTVGGSRAAVRTRVRFGV